MGNVGPASHGQRCGRDRPRLPSKWTGRAAVRLMHAVPKGFRTVSFSIRPAQSDRSIIEPKSYIMFILLSLPDLIQPKGAEQ